MECAKRNLITPGAHGLLITRVSSLLGRRKMGGEGEEIPLSPSSLSPTPFDACYASWRVSNFYPQEAIPLTLITCVLTIIYKMSASPQQQTNEWCQISQL